MIHKCEHNLGQRQFQLLLHNKNLMKIYSQITNQMKRRSEQSLRLHKLQKLYLQLIREIDQILKISKL